MKNAVLIIGSGSIANKHLTNLISLKKKVYVFSSGKNINNNFTLKLQKKINITNSIAKIKKKIDFAIVANATNNHIPQINVLAKNQIHIFCEKPISNNIKSLKKTRAVLKKNKIIFSTNYQLHQHNLFKFIKSKIKKKEILSVSLRVGQHIKNWRKKSPNSSSYFLDSHKGGGVIFELIHEVNLINSLFGNIIDIKTLVKKSDIYQNVEDIAISSFSTSSNILGGLYQDMISELPFRTIEIICKNKNYHFDLLANEVKIFYKNKTKFIKFQKSNCQQMFLLKKNLLNFNKKIKQKNYSLLEFDQAIIDLKICLKMHNRA